MGTGGTTLTFVARRTQRRSKCAKRELAFKTELGGETANDANLQSCPNCGTRVRIQRTREREVRRTIHALHRSVRDEGTSSAREFAPAPTSRRFTSALGRHTDIRTTRSQATQSSIGATRATSSAAIWRAPTDRQREVARSRAWIHDRVALALRDTPCPSNPTRRPRTSPHPKRSGPGCCTNDAAGSSARPESCGSIEEVAAFRDSPWHAGADQRRRRDASHSPSTTRPAGSAGLELPETGWMILDHRDFVARVSPHRRADSDCAHGKIVTGSQSWLSLRMPPLKPWK